MRQSGEWARTGLDGGPHPVNVHVGNQVRARRIFLGMTQSALADLLGLTFQQVQKYETGKNRISASRLKEIADVLKAPISYFFDGLALGAKPNFSEKLRLPKTLQLIRFYYAMPETVRRQFLEMLKSATGSRQ
jgi:transcriptional regulator with XRE-family HTH domain